MHLLYQGIKTIQPLGTGGILLHGEANTLVIRASSDTLSPRHARHPINGMKRQTNYIIVIDVCSWRSRAGSYRAGGLRRQQSSGQGDFTVGFLGCIDLSQLSNLQGPGARARPALAPGPQQYRLVRPSGSRLAFCSSSRQIKAAALRGFPLRRRNHDLPGCRSFSSASLGQAAGRRTQYTILLRGMGYAAASFLKPW